MVNSAFIIVKSPSPQSVHKRVTYLQNISTCLSIILVRVIIHLYIYTFVLRYIIYELL